MTFDEVLDQVREMLQSKGRMSYRALKRRFDLDDEYLEDLKSELIKAERVAVDEDGEVVVWTGEEPRARSKEPGAGSKERNREKARRPELRPSLPASQRSSCGPQEHETRTRLAETHRMLSEVYNWFTEGFDTKDLQEAKALIDELS